MGSEAQGLWDVRQENPSEQYQSLSSFNKIEMLNQHTDGQDVMLTKHIPRTRVFLFNNKTLMGPSFSSSV